MLNGSKMWISLGNFAKLALVFAQTDPELKHKGLACFLVDTDQDGYQPSEIKGKMGLWASDTAQIALDDVVAAPDSMLGQVGDGFKVAMSALDSGRYSVAAGCVGICQGWVEESVKYATERHAFDRPIASFQLVQEMIADMVVRTDAARMLVYRAGALKDAGQALDDRDVDRQVLRHRGRVLVRRPRHPGPRRRRLRRRPPGRALLSRRARDHALRGHLADPEAHHRPGGDRHQRAGPVLASAAPARASAGRAAPCRPRGTAPLSDGQPCGCSGPRRLAPALTWSTGARRALAEELVQACSMPRPTRAPLRPTPARWLPESSGGIPTPASPGGGLARRRGRAYRLEPWTSPGSRAPSWSC